MEALIAIGLALGIILYDFVWKPFDSRWRHWKQSGGQPWKLVYPLVSALIVFAGVSWLFWAWSGTSTLESAVLALAFVLFFVMVGLAWQISQSKNRLH